MDGVFRLEEFRASVEAAAHGVSSGVLLDLRRAEQLDHLLLLESKESEANGYISSSEIRGYATSIRFLNSSFFESIKS